MHMNELSELIKRLANNEGARILCVGDLMLDRFIHGDVSRISPEAPIPILAVRDETVMVGGAGNVVRNLVAIGVETELVAVIGDDAAGWELRSLLDAEALLERALGCTAGHTPLERRPYYVRRRATSEEVGCGGGEPIALSPKSVFRPKKY